MTPEELRARRAARGAADPLNRLRAHVSAAVAAGAEVATERPTPELVAERAARNGTESVRHNAAGLVEVWAIVDGRAGWFLLNGTGKVA